MSTGNQFLKAGGAAVLLVSFVVGLPWLNLTTGGHPASLLPRSWPDWSEPYLLDRVWSDLRWSFVDGSAWPWLAHVGLWCAWVIGMTWIVVDVVTLLRLGAAEVHHRVAAWTPRAWVSTLVAAVVTSVLTATASADTALPPAPALTSKPPVNPELRAVQIEVKPHDKLWSIAERELGDGQRWHDLWDWNRGVVQPDGRVLTRPNLIRPGWKLVAYIPTSSPSGPALPLSSQAEGSSSTITPPAEPLPPHTPEHPSQPRPADGVELPTGAYVSLALAASIATAVTSIHVWRRRRYRVGSGDRSDIRELGPVVRGLRAAYVESARPALVPDASRESYRLSVPLGVRDGQVMALNLATVQGLGLVGPGAKAAARALIVHLLADKPNVRVVVPATDVDVLFGSADPQGMPTTLSVAASIDSALDEIEHALVARTRQRAQDAGHRSPDDSLVLVATPTDEVKRRLTAVFANCAGLGVVSILLGHWRFDATLHVGADGSAQLADPGAGPALIDARLFTLPEPDASELLDVLRQSEGREEQRPVANDHEAAERDVQPVEDRSTQIALPPRPVELRVLGQFELIWHVDGSPRNLTAVITPKQREVLAYLALHRNGARRDAMNEAIWPDSRPPRPFNSMHNALSLMRRALRRVAGNALDQLILNDDGRYRLNDDLVFTDYGLFQAQLRISKADDGSTLSTAVELYHGDLAEDLAAGWVEPFRESARRDVLDALAALIRTTGSNDLEARLILLERARMLDQYNENIYRDIIRTHARLGQHDAIPRTLALLRSALSDLDQQPTDETVEIASTLQREIPAN